MMKVGWTGWLLRLWKTGFAEKRDSIERKEILMEGTSKSLMVLCVVGVLGLAALDAPGDAVNIYTAQYDGFYATIWSINPAQPTGLIRQDSAGGGAGQSYSADKGVAGRLVMEFDVTRRLRALPAGHRYHVYSADLRWYLANIVYRENTPATDDVHHIVDPTPGVTADLSLYDLPSLGNLGALANNTMGNWTPVLLDVTSAVQADLDAGRTFSSFRLQASDESTGGGPWYYNFDGRSGLTSSPFLALSYAVVEAPIPIPEPTTLGLLFLGSSLLVARRRRRIQ